MGQYDDGMDGLSRNTQLIQDNRFREQHEQRLNRQEQRQGVVDEENRAMNHLNFVANMVKMGGAPVNSDGIINKMLAMPSQLPGNGASGAGVGFTPQMSVERQADPGRTVGLPGRPQYELPTQDEFLQDQLRVQRINENQAGAIGYGQLIRKLQAESHFKKEQEKEATRIKAEQEALNRRNNGIELDPEIYKGAGIPAGTRFLPGELGGPTGLYNSRKPPKPDTATSETELAMMANNPQETPERRQWAANSLKTLTGQRASGRSGGGAAADDPTELSGVALRQAAESYAMTGTLPTLGMSRNAAAVRGKIMNMAAELYPDAQIYANKADYVSNSRSLATLQKTADAINAFEGTALKNLDVFLKTAQKVTDTGSPLLNQPLRALNRQLLGSAEQAAFDSARQTAVTEIAKVLNNPAGNAALSDSARHEVQELMRPDATFKQIQRAAQILKTDMLNRKKATADEIGTIRSRMKGGQGGAQQPHDGAASKDPLGIR